MRSSPVDPRFFVSAALLCGLVAGPGIAHAQTKEACLDAHGRGQDLRDAGKFSQAREQFLKCAQSACPSMVQADCARFGDELQRVVPTVTFAARGGDGADLPDTVVYVDDVQIAARLDGKSYELDPGARTVRFVHAGKSVEQRVVISQGEKGRMIVVTIGEPARPATVTEQPRTGPQGDAAPTASPETSRSAVPIVIAGIGGAALVAGVVLLFAGSSKIPDNCDYFAKECTAAANDPAYDEAKSGAGLINAGAALGIGGFVVLSSSLIWYFAQSPEPTAKDSKAGLSPWIGPRATGLSFRSAF